MRYFCGVDTGGTFTDCVVIDENGKIYNGKSPSTPKDISVGFFNALQVVAERIGIKLEGLLSHANILLHGTTVGTNIVLEHNGAKTGLITTSGHGDAIIMMRSIGRVAGLPIEQLLHVSRHRKPDPIVPRKLIKEVSERIDWKGEVFHPLNEDDVFLAVNELLTEGVTAIAVSFLWGFVNPNHENRVRDIIASIDPSIYVTCSHDLIAKPGEYERTAATAMNCYIGPASANYIRKVEERARALGYENPLLIMQASGGVATADDAATKPLFTVGSGPVGGIMGSKYLADLLGHKNVISSDVGGTSFDVGIISDSEPVSSTETTINQYTFFMPRIDIVSIGSGGGSVVWFDEISQTMKVGPRSAGADPGPACYQRGGTNPTVTDANVILGYLNPDNFLGGDFRLSSEASIKAFESIAQSLGMPVVEAASGAVQIAEFHMADLMRQMSVEKGYDPRDFVIYAFGGSGPIHAVSYAKELGSKTIVIPLGTVASTWSALGVQSSDILHVYEKTRALRAPFDARTINETFAELEHQARDQLHHDGIEDSDIVYDRYLDMKFSIQIHRVEVSVPFRELNSQDMADLVDRFKVKYEMLYGEGAAFSGAQIEIGNFRIRAKGKMTKPAIKQLEAYDIDTESDFRDVYWSKTRRYESTRIINGETLVPQAKIGSPAIIEMPETTIVLHHGSLGYLDDFGNFIIELT